MNIDQQNNAKTLAKQLIALKHPHIESTRAPIRARILYISSTDNPLGELVNDLKTKLISHKSSKYQHENEKNLLLIISNLILCTFSFEHLSLGTKITKGSYAYDLGLRREGVERITELLLAEDLLTKTRKGYLNNRTGQVNKPSQYFPSDKFIELVGLYLYSELHNFDDYIAYEYKGDERWDENETVNANIVKTYNEFMREHTWAFKAPTVRKLGVLPFTEGRLYTPYQNIVNRRAPIRSKTLLDAQPIVECDFSANHPFLLSYLSGVTFSADFYSAIAAEAGVDRMPVKSVVTKVIGSSKKLSIQNMAYKNEYGITADSVSKVLEAIKKLHPWFVDHMFRNRGVYLQWLEGEVTIRMLDFAVKNEIPLINVHDAYAVNSRFKSIIEKQMHQFRYEVLEDNKQKMLKLFQQTATPPYR